jgi:hypothetical protein
MPSLPALASRRKRPGNTCEAIHWTIPSAESEARSLLVCMKRTGATIADMVALITVTDAEYAALCEWAQSRPAIAGRIDDMMGFRSDVLKCFDALLRGGK